MFVYFGLGQDYDEDELEKELASLEQEDLDDQLLTVPTDQHQLPDVPNGDISASIERNKKSELKDQQFFLMHLINKICLLHFQFHRKKLKMMTISTSYYHGPIRI